MTAPSAATGAVVRRSLVFVVIGLILYAGVYAWSEWLVYRHADANRFFSIKTAPLGQYDYVILGASHAMPLDFEDMNQRLEAATGARILNLSTPGGGIVVNRVLLDYFLARHSTRNVVYFLDSFVFYSRTWNEERLKDTRLLQRAPFDPALLSVLARWDWKVAVDYAAGFSKINNGERFRPDVFEDEPKFRRTYRPIAQIDRQRMKYLYPGPVDPAVFLRYMGMFEDMIRDLHARGIELIVVKPPLPERVYAMIPDEAAFDEKLQALLQNHGVPFYDFTHVCNDERFFYNTDHLNRAGVEAFIDGYLKDVLIRHR